jgi:hypothetical protein
MAWLESHQDLRDHPKTARLRRRLGVSLPAAIGHLHLLWWWALTYDGDLSGYDPDVIADAGGWDADPGLFVRALTTSGFVDEDLRIHDWDDYAGRLIDRRTENARRMREAREQRRTRLNGHAVATSSAAPPSASGPREPDLLTTSGTCATQVQGLPYLTGPNQTEPDPTGGLHPNLPPGEEEGTFPSDVIERLSRLPDDLDAAAFHVAVESALVALRFSCRREVVVPERGDGLRGRLDLVAERHGVRIAFELDDRTPRRKSITKLLAAAECHFRVLVLRCPPDGELPRIDGDIVVIGAGVYAETHPLVPPTPEDLALWRRARDDVSDGMLPANAARLAALEPLGRGADGGLRLRAPPEIGGMGHFVGTVRAALAQAGDANGGNASIVQEG